MTPPFRAQFGEDRLLAEHFGHKTTGVYVEVGAYDGEDMSNTLYFERLGWSGILVEADPELAAKCSLARPRSIVVQCAAVGPDAEPTVSFEVSRDCRGLSALSLDDDHLARIQHYSGALNIERITVPASTLDEILTEYDPEPIDFLTIDVEGAEWDVLCGFSLDRWRPEILILERNTLWPDPRIMRHLHHAGYRYLRTTGVNDWFLRSSRGATRALSYRLGLWWSYYVPKYRERAKAILRRILKR